MMLCTVIKCECQLLLFVFICFKFSCLDCLQTTYDFPNKVTKDTDSQKVGS